jgi:hypothetical protein
MKFASLKQKIFKNGMGILIGLSLLKLFIHLFTNAFASYGLFRDEFYYIACSNRLALGYVDQPPLSIYVLYLSRLLFGDSLFAIRLLPAFAGALTVFVTGLIARKLGGGKSAVVIASLSIIFSPIHLAMNTYYSMNSLDALLWTLAAYVLVLMVKDLRLTTRSLLQAPGHVNQSLWVILGIVLGLGLLNKVGMLWFGFGLFVGLILTTNRKYLTTKWPWICGVLAFLLFSPFIIWNLTHDFAHVEFIRNASALKYSGLTRLDFIFGQILLQNPVSLPVWLAGLYFFFFRKKGKAFRILGYIYVVAFLVLLANKTSKTEYLSPAYSMLFAAGAVVIENLGNQRYWRWLKSALPSLIIVSGLLLVPFALPILPVKTFIKYSNFLGLVPPSAEGKELTELPQFFADMFGWENMAETVSRVYHSIPQEARSKAIIIARNYGEAGSLEYYRKKYQLPRVISAHNNYWLWGYGSDDVETVIIIGGDKEDYVSSFDKVEEAAVIHCNYCMPYENNLQVYVCRGPKVKLSESWDSLKHFE